MTATPLDLSAIPLVDDHCHAINRDQTITDRSAWQAFFTESYGPETATRHVKSTLVFRRMIHHLADFFGCVPTEEAVFAARSQTDGRELARRLFAAANIGTLVLDTGLPSPDVAMPAPEITELTGASIAPLLRVELLMQDLIAQCATLSEVEERLRGELSDVRRLGYVGLKSIVAYRSGLNIQRWSRTEAEASFATAREEAQAQGKVRIAHKPLLDTLLHLVFEQASAQELPVQFHTGYGDSDADMILANPLYLRDVLQDPRYRGMKFVLLHESYPYTQQAGYLAAVYDNVFLDISYVIPYLSYGAMVEFTREAFGVAPLSKLLYASDATWLPELYWLSAVDGRRVIGQVLAETVADGDLDSAEAERAAAGILRENALQLYGLDQ